LKKGNLHSPQLGDPVRIRTSAETEAVGIANIEGVVYGFTTPEEAPRGMELLYNRNRLNVATSRVRCACVLVASPRLLEPECRTPRQMQLASALCRYVEMAKLVTPA
jgi:hypothetical protein